MWAWSGMKAARRATESHSQRLYARGHLCVPVSFRVPRAGLWWYPSVARSFTVVMLPPRTLAPWLLLSLAFLVQQVSLSSGARGRNRGADKNATVAPGRGQRSGEKPASGRRGRFTVKDKILCTWEARDVRDTVRLSVTCAQPEARADAKTCRYTARPQRCPGYRSDNRGFWKQVGRALNRLQDKVCTDARALVKAGLCKRAPRDAHFKLDPVKPATSADARDRATAPPLPPRATSAAPTACTGLADHRKTAEEYCNSSWASVCSFLLSMVQRDC